MGAAEENRGVERLVFMPRIVLVGEDNPLSAAPEHALYNHPPGCAGWRLQRIFGLDDDAYLGLDRTNLCNPTWSAPRAVARAHILAAPGSPYDVIVMLGRKVRDAFGRALHVTFLEWQIHGDPGTASSCGKPPMLVALPHPSGRCQAWNHDGARDRARGILRLVAPDVAWGGEP